MSAAFGALRAEEAWLPWEPSTNRPFTRHLAAHLHRRAGFSANSKQLDQAVTLGPQDSVERLFATSPSNALFDEEMRRFALITLATKDPELLTSWWLHRMRHTPAPLTEKTLLFWHGHFATSAAKVREPELMFQQHQLLRKHALGSFPAMVRGIARDPAMLLYLDSATNRKNHPNENFAREVMELFCLGLGNYTEKDIQELARCFTGWEIQYREFKFHSFQHDYGSKTVLGKSGNFDGDDGLSIILDQPATAEFICEKLIRYFVTESEDLPSEFISALAKQFRDEMLNIAPVVRTILTSRLFYSDAAIGSKIRSPVELGIGLLSALDATANMRQLANQLRELGQMPFYPPNVKGWPGSRTWIDTSTLLGRANLVRSIVEGPETRFFGRSLADYVEGYGLTAGDAIVGWLSDLLLAVPAPADVRSQLARLIDENKNRSAAIAEAVHVLGSLPEFQLA